VAVLLGDHTGHFLVKSVKPFGVFFAVFIFVVVILQIIIEVGVVRCSTLRTTRRSDRCGYNPAESSPDPTQSKLMSSRSPKVIDEKAICQGNIKTQPTPRH
jgi:hypothetical protein